MIGMTNQFFVYESFLSINGSDAVIRSKPTKKELMDQILSTRDKRYRVIPI